MSLDTVVFIIRFVSSNMTITTRVGGEDGSVAFIAQFYSLSQINCIETQGKGFLLTSKKKLILHSVHFVIIYLRAHTTII